LVSGALSGPRSSVIPAYRGKFHLDDFLCSGIMERK
jgi:hypothetical protein